MANTLYIPSTLTSYFITKLRQLPPVGEFRCMGERIDVIAYKIWQDVNLGWILKEYNNILHPYDGSLDIGKTILFPSLNEIEKIYATLNAKQRALEKEETA